MSGGGSPGSGQSLLTSSTFARTLAAVCAAFSACLLTPHVCLVQVHSLAILRAAVRDLIFKYEKDPGGYEYLEFKLRAWVCGAPGAEVVAGSGEVATAISSCSGRGLSGAVESDSDNMYDVCNASLYKNSIVMLNSGIEQSKTVFSSS